MPSCVSARAVIGASCLLLALSCAREWKDAGTPEHPNILFVVVDTLRVDRLGCYGNTRGLTPNLDRLAREGVRFENAFAHAPWTLPSFASLFTSLVPEAHGAGGNVREGWRGLDRTFDTLAERFEAEGWDTAAIVNVDFLSQPFGLMQGFRHVDPGFAEDNQHARRAGPTTDAALAWIEHAREKPFFLFVHYFDPHAAYDPPPEWRARFAEPQDRDNTGFSFGTRGQVVLQRNGKLPLDPRMMSRAAALYDGEVAYTDAEIGRLLDGLEKKGLARTTLVVFTADHGEEFLDHGGWEHGHTLYDELLHVPLVVRAPRGVAPAAVKTLVGHVDVAPTVCALAGIAPSPQFSGRDLGPLFVQRSTGATGTVEPRPLLAYGNFWGAPWASFRDETLQLVRTPAFHGGDGAVEGLELYAWSTDPRETKNLAAERRDEVLAQNAAFERWLREKKLAPAHVGPKVVLDSPMDARLHELGYSDGR